MRYIKIENGIPVDYSIEQLLQDYPDAIIYKKSQMPSEKLLKNYNVFPLITEPSPPLKEDITVEESTPEFRQGEWHQTWAVRKLTKQEMARKIQDVARPLSQATTNNPTHLVTNLAKRDLQEQRYNICKTCDSFTSLKMCQECSCIIPLKIKLSKATCPLKKW